jgi:hypothetical protein
MRTPRYDWHREILGLPSTIGALLLGMAIHGWWLGILLMFLALVLFYQPYRLYFSTTEGHPRRRHVGTNLLFVAVQLIVWAIMFGLLHAIKNTSAL